MLISFVIPCYRSEKTIAKVVDEIRLVVSRRKNYDYEIVCINDCSPDGVFAILENLASNDASIKVIDFAKNMGKHAAVLAGYMVATGDYIVTLDDDYQSPVCNLWMLIDPLEKDLCDVATANYIKKKQSWWKNAGSSFNQFMTGFLLDKPRNLRFDNFNAMKLFVAKEIIKYKNPYPFLDGLITRTTGRILTVKMEERNRADNNTTGYTLKRSIDLFINGFTAFSVKPLRVSTTIGFIAAFLGFLWAIITFIRKLLNPLIEVGYTSMLIFILIFGGLILMSQGMLGEYIGRIYICLNASPQYVIRRTINVEKTDSNPDRASQNRS